MITTILANSDGWSWNEPNWNHACAPRVFVPSGESTASEHEHGADVEHRREVAQEPVVDDRGDHHHDDADARPRAPAA